MENICRGKFIAIEGGDGSGKGTAIKILRETFADGGVVFTREPGGTPLGEQIREMLQKNAEDEMCVMTEMLLFNASRAEHLEKVIKPALLSGKHVICDRFSLSTLAYQIYGQRRDDFLDKFRKLDQIVVDVNPDLYILLDLDPEVAHDRVMKSGRDKLSRFDEKGVDFYRMVRLGYISNIGKFNNKIVDVGDKPPLEVQREVLQIAKEFLGK
ncbi:MAG: dTMP kinase [Candidatus Vogelbacteria bacterium]|nr:dTMP kinase [Candidatus Vogelbacteria bacterium]